MIHHEVLSSIQHSSASRHPTSQGLPRINRIDIMPETGIHICVLRGIQIGEFKDRVSIFFAPLRAPQPIPGRVSCIEQSLASSDSPERDIRVQMDTPSIPWHLFVAGALAKMERSPIFLVDAGSDGSAPIVLSEIEDSMLAGSMGLVIKVPLGDLIVRSLMSLSAGEDTVLSTLIDVASTIYSNWPSQSKFFFANPHRAFVRVSERQIFSSAAEEDQYNILQIVHDLILASPLVLGIWPPVFSTIFDEEHQFLSENPFQSYRMRDISEVERKDPVVIRTFLSILRSLESIQFPVWMSHLMGDAFTIPVVECIRYLPHLYYHRCPIRQEDYSTLLTSSVVPGSHYGVVVGWVRRELRPSTILRESYPAASMGRLPDVIRASIHDMESRIQPPLLTYEGPPISSIIEPIHAAIAQRDRSIGMGALSRYIRFNKARFDPGRNPNMEFVMDLIMASPRSAEGIPFDIAGSGEISLFSEVPMTPGA